MFAGRLLPTALQARHGFKLPVASPAKRRQGASQTREHKWWWGHTMTMRERGGAVCFSVARPPPASGASAMRVCARMSIRRSSFSFSARAPIRR
eukprot:5096058-Pleurochrysis_carterae.AAC.1